MSRNTLYRVYVFCCRILRSPRTLGFGVQSPTAYSILRNVINERIFLKNWKGDSSKYPFYGSKQERLLFRLHSHFHPVIVYGAASLTDLNTYNKILSEQNNHSVLLLSDIHRDNASRLVWQRFLADNRVILSYDLLDCGVAFFDNTKFKQNFKVNY